MRKYIARVTEYGIPNVLDRVASGQTMRTIAADLGVGRSFLSTYLNKQGAADLAFARALWAYKRITGRSLDKQQIESHLLVAEAPAMHLEALKQLRGGGPA
jgi:hypothetical protein